MSNNSEDRTVAFQDPTAVLGNDHGGGSAAGVPRARLICLDTSTIEGPLPGEGLIRLQSRSEQIVGRGDTCTFTIPSRKLSRQHARIFPGEGAWGIEDMNSTNGIQVNRQKVKTAWLKDGDEVRFGPIPFRFEVERAESASAGRPMPAAAPEEGSEDRTMMVGSLGASRAVIEAAQRKEEPPPPPPKPTAARMPQPKSGAGAKAIVPIVLGILVAAGLGVGGYLYYPTYKMNQQISDIIGQQQPVIERVILRGREINTAAPSDVVIRRDLEELEPVIVDLNRALQQFPNRPELANLYARARILSFERTFGNLYAKDETVEAGAIAAKLKEQLESIKVRLPAEVPEKDRAELEAAIDISDLAGIMVTYREFTKRYSVVARPAPGRPVDVPTIDQLNAVERRKEESDQYRRSLNKELRGDYRLFNASVSEFENRDRALMGRWRQFLQTQ